MSAKRQRLATDGPSSETTATVSVAEGKTPSIITVGGGCSKQLPETLRALGVQRPLIVTDPFIEKKSGLLEPILEALDEAGVPHTVFGDCVPDPTTDSVAAGMRAWRSAPEAERADVMIGIGGGSSIDSAKAMAMLALCPEDARMRHYKVPCVPPAGLPVIAVPTTAGTGSECTKVTIISDTETSEKMLCMGPNLLPAAALVDYKLTLSMPYRLTADSGLDSLCHAMEAYVSRKHNAFADTHAIPAMRAIPSALRTVCADLSDESAREALMVAATHAGVAFSNASVTLIHGMSRPIGAHFHVPHGLSNAMLLPLVTEFSIPGAPERYAECARFMGFATADDDDAAANALLVSGLRDLCRELRVPSPEEHGISEGTYTGLLETMASQALASGSPNNNPVVPTAEQIKDLYRRVYRQREGTSDCEPSSDSELDSELTSGA